VEAYGSVDRAEPRCWAWSTRWTAGNWLAAEFATIQSKLLHVGAELAASAPDARRAAGVHLRRGRGPLERWIDRLEAELEPLTSFVLPGGSPLGAQLHVARAVCRRAERRTVSLLQAESVQPRLVRYLNRLGDLLFVMARWCNRRAGAPETEWHPRRVLRPYLCGRKRRRSPRAGVSGQAVAPRG